MSSVHVTPKIHLLALALATTVAATVAAMAKGGTVTPPRAPSRVAVTLRAAVNSDLGLRFDGVGAISGGGATSKLLGAYPPEQRGEILDLLFKPGYGASLQILKVEIGGDGQATEGTESSHMHTAEDEAYDRGYEWWLMKEAKARNPAVSLYGLPWTFPGWVTESGKGGTTDNSNLTLIAQVLTPKTARYVSRWIDGAKDHHNLSIDWIGLWNEHPPTPDYAVLLRQALDLSKHGSGTKIVGPDWHTGKSQGTDSSNGLVPFMKAIHMNATVQAAVARVGFHYPKRLADAATRLGPLYVDLPVPVWSSEESSTTDTPAGGACWARLLSQNYVVGDITATIMWNLVSSYYSSLPYFGASLMNAGEPWSGHYEVMTPIWATAHHTQFTAPGWQYLGRDSGVGFLPGGGTYVTYVSALPAGEDAFTAARDWTIVIEKITASTGPCLRDSFTNDSMVADQLRFNIGPGLKTAGVMVQVWTSDWSNGEATQDSDLFQFAGEHPLRVGQDGVAFVDANIAVDHVITISSLARSAGHGNHGSAAVPPPSSAPFPLHYENNFEDAALDTDEPYLADQAGHWEVRLDDQRAADGSVGGVSNQLLKFVVPEIGVVYRGDKVPIAVLGGVGWENVTVRMRFRVENASAGGFYLGLRVLNHQRAPGGDPAAHPIPQCTRILGTYLVWYLNGTTAVVGDNYFVQDGLNASFAAASTPPTALVPPLGLNVWHNVTMSISGSRLSWSLGDVKDSIVLDPGQYPAHGQVAIGLVDFGGAAIDDIVINAE